MGLGELTLAGAVTGEDADVPVLQPPTCLSGRISAWTRSAGREAGTSGGKNVQTSIIGSRWFACSGLEMANIWRTKSIKIQTNFSLNQTNFLLIRTNSLKLRTGMRTNSLKLQTGMRTNSSHHDPNLHSIPRGRANRLQTHTELFPDSKPWSARLLCQYCARAMVCK